MHFASTRNLTAIAVILMAMFAMSLQAIAMKSMSSSITIWQITIFRSLTILIFLIPILLFRQNEFPTSIKWLSVRSGLMVIMNLFYYGSLPLMSVAVAATANYSAPIFIFLMGAIFLKEKINLIGIVAVLVAFLSGVLVIRPGTDEFNAFVIFPIIAAIAYGSASIVTRLRCRDESVLVMVVGVHIAFFVVGCIGQLFVSFNSEHLADLSNNSFIVGEWTPMTTEIWGIILGLAILNTATHTGFAKAYQMAPSSMLAPWEYTYLPFVVVLGIFFFAEVPDILTIFAMVTIVASGLMVLWSDRIISFVKPSESSLVQNAQQRDSLTR